MGMMLTRNHPDGPGWTLTMKTWHILTALAGTITVVLALATPWVHYQAGIVADAKDAPISAQVKVLTEDVSSMKASNKVAFDLQEQNHRDLKQDISDMRADVRSIREMLTTIAQSKPSK